MPKPTEQIDPRDLFITSNPSGLCAVFLEKGRSGFVDFRTHSDYLIFLAGYEASAEAIQIDKNPGHRDQVNAEGCKPEISTQPDSSIAAAGTVAHDLNQAEGEQPDLNVATSQLAKLAAKKLIDSGAENYVGDVYTISLDTSDQSFEVIVTTQRVGAKTPHELHAEAAAERDTLSLQVAERGALLEHWFQLANVCDDNQASLMKETRALLDSEPPIWQPAIKDVLMERRRQIAKGYTAEHDDHYGLDELAAYGAVHALLATDTNSDWRLLRTISPWEVTPDAPRTLMVKAAALMLAALDSLDRSTERARKAAELQRLHQLGQEVRREN